MGALEELKKLSVEGKKGKHTSVPHYAIVPPKYSDKSTNELTKCVIDYIKLLGGYATRINTQGNYSQSLGNWIKSGTTPGTADIHACYNGVHLSIEIKHGKDKLSEDQIKTREEVERSGGLYFVAKTFQGFYDWFNCVFSEAQKERRLSK